MHISELWNAQQNRNAIPNNVEIPMNYTMNADSRVEWNIFWALLNIFLLFVYILPSAQLRALTLYILTTQEFLNYSNN